jgi:hypothetical protein
MVNFRYIFIVALTVGLSGCGAKLPECGETELLESVKKIVASESEKKGFAVVPGQLVLDGIETTAKDDKLGKNLCQANISVTISERAALIIKDLEEGSPETMRDLAFGIFVQSDSPMAEGAIKGLFSFYGLGGVTPMDPKDWGYQILKGQLDNSVGAVKGAVTEGINSVGRLENGKILRQVNEKLKYVVRKNEDKSSAQPFYVEVGLPLSLYEVVVDIESLVGLVEAGKARIARGL